MPDLLYCYPNSNVLKNKFDIRDEEKLDKVERDITFLKLSQINEINKIFENGFEYGNLKDLHKFIFGNIYAWAGQEREIEIIKNEKVLGGLSVTYSYPTEIKKNAEKCIKKMHKIDWQKLELDEKADIFSKCIAELWQVHPFREGNTRTVITFACEFADKHGFPMDRELLSENAGYTRNALVMASIGQYSEYQHLTRIFADSMERGSKAQLKNYLEQLSQDDNSKQETATISKKEYDALNQKYNDLLEAYNVLFEASAKKTEVISFTNLVLNEHPELKEGYKKAKAETMQKKVEKDKGCLSNKTPENKNAEYKPHKSKK